MVRDIAKRVAIMIVWSLLVLYVFGNPWATILIAVVCTCLLQPYSNRLINGDKRRGGGR